MGKRLPREARVRSGIDLPECPLVGAGIVIRGGAAKGAPTEGKAGGVAVGALAPANLDDLLDGMTPMEFILRFTFTNPDLDTTIVGRSTRRTCRPTSTSCSKARCRRTSTRRLNNVSLPQARLQERVRNDGEHSNGRLAVKPVER